MDNSKEFQLMLDEAIKVHPQDFVDFDRTKNVQDQLQEMVGHLVYDVMYKFNTWVATTLKYWDVTSFEQLWLAFVMKENHNKIWSRAEWIKELKC